MPLINFSGLASGIDSEALIEAISEAARARYATQEQKVADLTNTNDALEELTTKAENVRDLLQKFREINGGGLVKEATSTDQTIATASASSTASNTSFDLTVSTIASVGTMSFDDTDISSLTDAIAPTITVTTPGVTDVIVWTIGTPPNNGESVTVTVDATTTLANVVDDFNSASNTAIATYVNTKPEGSTPEYHLLITTNNSGTLEGSIAVSVGSDITTAGRFNGTENIDQATDAVIQVSGITGTITRPSNAVDDVIPGVTMNLLKANTTSSTTITVKDDIPSTAADIEEFVDAYNDMVEFVNESNRVVRESEDEDSLNIFSPLALTTLDDNMIANIRTEIAKATAGNDVSGSNFEVNIFANIGITTERDGTLLFNPDATVSTDNQGFETAMNADPESVRRLLQNFAEEVATLNTAGGVIHQYTAFNGLFDQAETNNKDNIRSLNDRIARQEAAILRREDALRAQFARLERTTAELQSQQGALTSALAGLG